MVINRKKLAKKYFYCIPAYSLIYWQGDNPSVIFQLEKKNVNYKVLSMGLLCTECSR